MNCRLLNLGMRRAERGFTMVEIAIALGVIGFALVAIIGILPSGLEVQRDNRSETIINQDATFWLEAIRSGAQGIEDLPNYVTNVAIIIRNPIDNSIVTSNNYTYNGGYTTGAEIIGLITFLAGLTNAEARLHVTAINGSAAEKELDPSKRELAFSYLLRVILENQDTPDIDNGGALPFAAIEGAIGAGQQLNSLYEARLTFSYPFVKETQAPSRSRSFRASINRELVIRRINGSDFLFFAP